MAPAAEGSSTVGNIRSDRGSIGSSRELGLGVSAGLGSSSTQALWGLVWLAYATPSSGQFWLGPEVTRYHAPRPVFS